MNNDYWYNIKNNNGSISIEKTKKKENTYVINNYYLQRKKDNSWKGVLFVLPLLIIVPIIIAFLLTFYNGTKPQSKYRTFMIYMVGSDLESNGKIATYDLNDISGNNIDLENNNVLLMVGGAEKWHNFVNKDELAIYKLTRTGFKKEKTYNLSNMGKSETLSKFLNYTTNNYKSEKYDLIFWNHGLGALGIENDELFKDFLDLKELNDSFKNSLFGKEKLELVIFNNCMSGNIHIASIMKNYANYMVASEEVLYVGSIINRLNFLNDIKKDNNGYDIGISYIKKSDESIVNANNNRNMNLNSTLSIIDLSKINDVENSINEYFKSINIETNYNNISRARRRTSTYGDGEYYYDTVDLYSFINNLDSTINNTYKDKLQNSIEKAVLYNSANDYYSNGLSIYFPYFGSDEYIASHLYVFDKLWNNDYINFIHSYVDLTTKAKRANRVDNQEILLLENNVAYEDNKVSIELNDKEKESYQDANIYIFEKNEDGYRLLLKSDEIELSDNKLITDDIVFLKSSNNKIISSIKEKGLYKIYGLYNDSSVVIKVGNNEGYGVINNIVIDSKDKPAGGIVEFNDEDISYYSLNYNNLKEELDEEWNLNIDRELINNKTNDISLVLGDLNNYYVLIELFDINNDVYYSNLTQIK